jgi:hypothetical protein
MRRFYDRRRHARRALRVRVRRRYAPLLRLILRTRADRHAADAAVATQSIRAAGLTRPPLAYRSYADVPVWLGFLWAGWLATVWSNMLVWLASRFYLAHPDAPGVAEKAAPGSRAAHASGSQDGLQAA